MSETKAALAERTIRSKKHLLYRFLENYEDKLQQFVTTLNSGKSCSLDIKQNDVGTSKFLSYFHTNLYDSTENQN